MNFLASSKCSSAAAAWRAERSCHSAQPSTARKPAANSKPDHTKISQSRRRPTRPGAAIGELSVDVILSRRSERSVFQLELEVLRPALDGAGQVGRFDVLVFVRI